MYHLRDLAIHRSTLFLLETDRSPSTFDMSSFALVIAMPLEQGRHHIEQHGLHLRLPTLKISKLRLERG